MNILKESVVCPPHADYPFYITAKRYWLQAFEAFANDPDSLTLVVLHSTSFHKEAWEPALEYLFRDVIQKAHNRVKIREAWSIDCPNHGEAAVLNEKVLRDPKYAAYFCCGAFADAVHRFFSWTPTTKDGTQVNFRKRNLVGIGHSLGSNVVLILQEIKPSFQFSFLIIVEPMLSPNGTRPMDKLRLQLVKIASERRDVWSNRAVAKKELGQRNAKAWHPRVLELYAQYGLRTHPDANAPVAPYGGVTLACSRLQEVAMYRDVDGLTKPTEALIRPSGSLRIHLILGSVHDYIPATVQEALLNQSSVRYASVHMVDHAGHLVPQTHPEQLAWKIFQIFLLETARAKL